MRKILLSIIVALFSVDVSCQGLFVNQVFQNESGSPLFNPVLNPLGVQWSKSVHSVTGGLIMVGYTSVSAQGQNIYLVKHSSSGRYTSDFT